MVKDEYPAVYKKAEELNLLAAPLGDGIKAIAKAVGYPEEFPDQSAISAAFEAVEKFLNEMENTNDSKKTRYD